MSLGKHKKYKNTGEMIEELLIQKSDFLGYRAISANIKDVDRLTPFVLEAQRLDLINLLGEKLYFGLCQNIMSYRAAKALDPNYVPTAAEQSFLYLLNGRVYAKETVNISFLGIVPVLVYLTYARFVRNDGVFSTPSGFVKKNTDFSEHISDKAVREMASRAEGDANKFFSDVERYITSHEEEFKDFAISGCCDSGSSAFAPETRCSTRRRLMAAGSRIRRGRR